MGPRGGGSSITGPWLKRRLQCCENTQNELPDVSKHCLLDLLWIPPRRNRSQEIGVRPIDPWKNTAICLQFCHCDLLQTLWRELKVFAKSLNNYLITLGESPQWRNNTHTQTIWMTHLIKTSYLLVLVLPPSGQVCVLHPELLCVGVTLQHISRENTNQ